MEGIEMDEIAVFRCAVRSGYNIRKPSDVTDAMKVEMVRRKSSNVAKYILKECYWLTYDDDEKDEDQHPPVQFFGDLGYDKIPTADKQGLTDIDFLLDGLDFVADHSTKLGADYVGYLSKCFNTAKLGCLNPKYDDHGKVIDWLAQAFNLRQNKKAGQPIDLERDADSLDGMEFIYSAMSKRTNSHASQLEEKLQRFLLGESSQFPHCIDRLITLKGYPQAAEYLPTIRSELAEWILKEIERVRKAINGKVKPNRMIAANIFMRCSDKCVDQVDLLLAQPDMSDADKDRLRDKREILRDYGSESLQSNNKSGSATGFERLFRAHRDNIHPQIKRSLIVRSVDELEDILDDLDIRRKKKTARSNPTVRKAIRIIKSPDVGNHDRAELLMLQNQTPKDAQIIWPDLWEEFKHRALVVVKGEDMSSRKQ